MKLSDLAKYHNVSSESLRRKIRKFEQEVGETLVSQPTGGHLYVDLEKLAQRIPELLPNNSGPYFQLQKQIDELKEQVQIILDFLKEHR